MYKIFKRLFDFIVSFSLLLIISPLFILIVIVLKLSGEKEVFYLQERIGYENVPFNIYKFATMLKDSPNMGNKTLTVRNDPRITKVGKYLRITKLNELPQLINVLKGDMSFVGPRPLLSTSVLKYSTEVQKIIYLNKPGITGLGSVVFRDEEKLVSEVVKLGGNPMEYYGLYIYPYKGQLEKYYYSNISLTTDFKILIATAWILLFKKSNLIYKFFSDLPPKPESLTIYGISKLKNQL